MNNSSPSNGSSAPTDNAATNPIEALLRKAEMQQMQLKLEVQFKRNMEAFKVLAPKIYEQFIDYEPEELRLEFSSDGYLSLVNYKLNNKPVYEGDPKAFTDKQFSDFCTNPSITSISFAKSNHRNQSHVHPRIINEMIEAYKPTKANPKTNVKVPIGFMLVTGCGLGYHFEAMMQSLDIHHLCIYDPHKDSFYAALHTIDWLPILQKLCVKGKMLKLFLGVSPEDAMADMKLLSDKIGLFNLVYTYVYRHFTSTKEEAFINLYRREFHLNATGTGFFDDEQISLAHTVININKGFPFFRHGTLKTKMPHVFVLGNGPSLDQHIDYIRANQNNAIIITCGTAISSLCKTGIKPDFHVEMERSSATPAYIDAGTTPEYRQGIPLLALNTAPPNMTELFDEVCLAIKPNDMGKIIFDNCYPESNIHSLALCNPTVTNAGVSFALGMGFKNIVLFGIDLGMKDENSHHSSLSVYHDIERETKTKIEKFKFKGSDYKIAANFGGEVYTNSKLHSTKTNIEILLRHAHQVIPDIKILNPNDGALIDGALPTPSDELPSLESIENKTELVTQLKQLHFKTLPQSQLSEEAIKEQYLNYLFDIRSRLVLSKNIENQDQLHSEMTRIFGELLKAKKESPATTLLMRGSINSLLTLLAQGLTFAKDKYEFKKNFNIGRKFYMEMIKGAYNLMENRPLQADTTRVDVASQLNKKTAPSN